MALSLMIVEDEPLIAADLAEILGEEGHRVVGTAHTLQAALDLAARHKPNLAIVDIDLGAQYSGIDLAEALGSRFRVQVLFLTGRSDFMIRAMALDIEPLGFISKPYARADILTALRNAV